MRWLHWHGRPSPDAVHAVKVAEKHLHEAQDRWRKVDEVTGKAEQMMRRNHFAESIANALRERR